MSKNNKKIYKIFSIIFIIIWCTVVFLLSAEPSTKSSNTSGRFVNIVLKILFGTTNVELGVLDSITFVIRKLAHFTLYALGGFLIYNLFMCYNISNKKRIIYSYVMGTFLAALDETHQFFVPGRSAELRDVIIDSVGIFTGLLVFKVFYVIINKVKEKVKMSKNKKSKKNSIYLVIKRVLDFVISLIGIIVLSPLLLILMIVIKIDSKGPVFFKQRRITKGKKEFKILKFRTMKIDTPKDTPTHLLKNAESYITRVGKILRKTSLDELPQIFNILSGKMSIVGPRPALYNQNDLIELRDKYGANDILPGLTGLAQISGRDELEIEKKAKLDGEYVEKMSLFFDIKIFFKTIGKVFKSDGVVEGKKET